MYDGDIFLALTSSGQWAVAALSAVLAFLAVVAVRLTRRHVSAAAAPAIGVVYWWLFLWLTPQLYYLLYMLLIEGLPFRLMVLWPPGAGRLLELLLFRSQVSLADHALGALGWAMLLASLPNGDAAVVRRRRRPG